MFPSVADNQIIWQSVFKISVATVYKMPNYRNILSTVADATLAQCQMPLLSRMA